MDQTRSFLLGQMAGAKTLQDYHLAFLALQRLESLLAAHQEERFIPQAGNLFNNQRIPRTRPAPQPSEPYRAFVAQPLPPEYTRPVPQVRDDVAPDFDSIEVPGEEFTYNP